MILSAVVIEAHGLVKALGLWEHADRLRVVEFPEYLTIQVLDQDKPPQVLSICLDLGHVMELHKALSDWMRLCKYGKKGGEQ